jgi:hypothetical protein
MKKTILLLITSVMLALLLSACGRGGVENVQPVKFQYLFQDGLAAAHMLALQFHAVLTAAALPWAA